MAKQTTQTRLFQLPLNPEEAPRAREVKGKIIAYKGLHGKRTLFEALEEMTDLSKLLRLPVPYRLEFLPNGDYEAIWQPPEPTPGFPSVVKGESGTSPLVAVERLRERLEEYKIIEAKANIDLELAEIAQSVEELEGK